MKQFVFCLIPFCLLSGWLSAHPLKMAYTSVKYDAVRQVFEISHRVFQDDFEATLIKNYRYTGGDVFLNQKNQATQKVVNEFFQKNFSITFNNKIPVSLTYIKTEQKNQMGIIIYYETNKIDVSTIHSVEVYNFILMESFREQVNMFHLAINDIKRTVKFELNKTREKLLL